MGQAIESIFNSAASRLSFCCAVVTKIRKVGISRLRSDWLTNGVNDMAEQLSTYDPAAVLDSDDAIAIFMADAFETGDAAYIAKALGVVARAKGIIQIAGKTGLPRKQLDQAFSEDGNPTLKTTLAVMKAIGIEMTT